MPMKSPILSRWQICLFMLLAVWLLTACAVPRVPSADGPKPSARTATPIPTPTPGPQPTATPQPLKKPDADKAAALVTTGKARFLKSDLTGAEQALIEAIAADPKNVQAYINLTRVYIYLPQYWQQALSAAETAVKLAPDDALAQAYLAWAQQGAHQFEEAQKTAMHAAELAPDNATVNSTVQATLADTLSSVYAMDAAYAAAKQAVQLDDQNAVAWSTLGSIADALNYWEEAGKAFDQAARLEPDFFVWHLLQARHEFNISGDVEEANALLQPVLQVQPDHPWVLSFEVDTALEKNDWKGAEATCQKLFAVNQPSTPYPDAYSCMAGVLIVQERYADAEPYQALAEAVATPERNDISLLRMRLYSEHEQCSQARDLAQHWLEQHPYSVLAQRMVGVSYLCDGNYAKAIENFKATLEKLPRSVADARLLANAYARAGQASEARAALNQVAAFSTHDPLYYQALYEAYLFLGQHQDAINAAEQWQKLRPNNADAKVSLALAQLIDGDFAAAQKTAQRALDDGATGATLYAVLGETYHRQGDFAKAEQYLLQSLAIADNNFLAHNFILALYLAHGDCDKAAPHVRWLQENSQDQTSIGELQALLASCQSRKALPTPSSKAPLADDEVIDEIKIVLRDAGVAVRSTRFAEDNQQMSLVVAYTMDANPMSREFTEMERAIVIALARLLPRVSSQPDGLVLLSGARNVPQTITYVATKAAALWANGELSDAEFEKTWVQRSAKNLR